MTDAEDEPLIILRIEMTAIRKTMRLNRQRVAEMKPLVARRRARLGWKMRGRTKLEEEVIEARATRERLQQEVEELMAHGVRVPVHSSFNDLEEGLKALEERKTRYFELMDSCFDLLDRCDANYCSETIDKAVQTYWEEDRDGDGDGDDEDEDGDQSSDKFSV
jgi:hypothetical protein